MTAHHRLRRIAAASLAALALVLAACSSSGHSGHSGNKVHFSASKSYPDAAAIATALYQDKVACGTPTTVTKLPDGVQSEVSCQKTHYGVLDVVVFSGATIPAAWTASYHHVCSGSPAATDYVRGKNWAIVAANTATGNGGIERLAHRMKIAIRSFCS
jgi:hypothetical protein